MKKLVIFMCLVLSALTLYAKAIQEDYRHAEENALVSYAFGIAIGANLRSVELEFDYNAFRDGVKAALGDAEAQITEQEAIEIIETALQKVMEKATEENRLREVEFLTMNMERPEIQVTPSGLQYEVIIDTDGEKPESDSLVRVLYRRFYRRQRV